MTLYLSWICPKSIGNTIIAGVKRSAVPLGNRLLSEFFIEYLGQAPLWYQLAVVALNAALRRQTVHAAFGAVVNLLGSNEFRTEKCE